MDGATVAVRWEFLTADAALRAGAGGGIWRAPYDFCGSLGRPRRFLYAVATWGRCPAPARRIRVAAWALKLCGHVSGSIRASGDLPGVDAVFYTFVAFADVSFVLGGTCSHPCE